MVKSGIWGECIIVTTGEYGSLDYLSPSIVRLTNAEDFIDVAWPLIACDTR